MARIVMGSLAGACLSVSAGQLMTAGAVLGGLGAVVGAFAGYEGRRRLVSGLKVKDLYIAISEDLLAIGLAAFLVSR